MIGDILNALLVVLIISFVVDPATTRRALRTGWARITVGPDAAKAEWMKKGDDDG